MPEYNFKKNVKLYVVIGGLQYRIDSYPDITFSQTFDERPIDVKTLHAQTDMFDDAVITKANPANFSFTTPIRVDLTQKIVFDLLVDYDSTSSEKVLKTADLYVDDDVEIYKLEGCVFERGTFSIARDTIVVLTIQGTAKKLSLMGGGYTIPGTPQTYTDTQNYIIPYANSIQIAGNTQNYITSISIEIANTVNWIDYNTIHKSLAVTGPSDTAFPEAFVVSKRAVTGSIVEYVTDDNYSGVNTWSTNSTLRIRVGNSNAAWTLDFNIPKVVYTNRLDTQDLFLQAYDFRMTHNPTSLSSIIVYS